MQPSLGDDVYLDGGVAARIIHGSGMDLGDCHVRWVLAGSFASIASVVRRQYLCELVEDETIAVK